MFIKKFLCIQKDKDDFVCESFAQFSQAYQAHVVLIREQERVDHSDVISLFSTVQIMDIFLLKQRLQHIHEKSNIKVSLF